MIIISFHWKSIKRIGPKWLLYNKVMKLIIMEYKAVLKLKKNSIGDDEKQEWCDLLLNELEIVKYNKTLIHKSIVLY